MNILFTNAAAPAISPFSTAEKRMPLGIGHLISVLLRAGHKVFFIDNYLRPSRFIEEGYLTRNRIDVVGVSLSTICFGEAAVMLGKLQDLREKGTWNGRIIAGGPHASVSPETIPEYVDHVVRGEGERAILAAVEGHSDRTIQAERIADLDALPSPAWEYFARLPYDYTVSWFPDRPVFTMSTSRGCPYACSFCSSKLIWERRYTCFSAERVFEDVRHLVGRYGAKGIYFREDNFAVNRERVRRFCELLLGSGIRIKWCCELRVDNIDRELLRTMRDAGLAAVYVGVESGSQRMLDLVRKGITVEQVEEFFRNCRELGIKTAASFIVGLPGEEEDDIRRTGALIDRIAPDTVWRNVFVGIPRSELYEHVVRHRLYEYIDENGLLYLRDHDRRVDEYYGGDRAMKIPFCGCRPPAGGGA